MRHATVSIRIEAEAARAAKVDAVHRGVSMSAWISGLIMQAHAREEAARGAARRPPRRRGPRAQQGGGGGQPPQGPAGAAP